MSASSYAPSEIKFTGDKGHCKMTQHLGPIWVQNPVFSGSFRVRLCSKGSRINETSRRAFNLWI